jgi:hypothetical protein
LIHPSFFAWSAAVLPACRDEEDSGRRAESRVECVGDGDEGDIGRGEKKVKNKLGVRKQDRTGGGMCWRLR